MYVTSTTYIEYYLYLGACKPEDCVPFYVKVALTWCILGKKKVVYILCKHFMQSSCAYM